MIRRLFIACGIACITSVMLCLMLYVHLFSTWQDTLTDNLFFPHAAHPDIAIIAIDDASLQTIGRWPWDRTIHAKLLTILGNHPKAIGLDVSFPEASTTDSDQAFKQAIAQTDTIIPITAGTMQKSPNGIVIQNVLFPTALFRNPTRIGLVNMATDGDNVTRHTPIDIAPYETEVIDNFSIAILKKYYHVDQLPGVIPTEHGSLRIRFVGPPKTFPTVSYKDVLNGKITPELFDGKIVLIGATALDLHDTLLTPTSHGVPMSGVEVHANILQTILDKKFLVPEPAITTIITISLVSIVSTIIFSLCNITISSVCLFIFCIAYIIYAITSFDQGTIRHLIFPPFTMIITYIATLIYKYFTEQKQKRFIKKAFSYYLSESVMKDVLSNPKKLTLGGERKEISVLFSDIAGFTTISEKLPPEKLALFLNQYLTQMTHIVFANAGVLDKYIGDAVMAFWGAPLPQKNHALLACTTALDMQTAIQKIKEDWKTIGIDNFDVRIGINTGEMVVGNMGSDQRFDYTLLGDNVNLGSRLEGINKEYGTHIIMSGATYSQVKHEVIARRIDSVAVKGKTHGVEIYELRGIGHPTDEEKEFLTKFEQARSLYESGTFKEALLAFNLMAKSYPHDEATHVYIHRCKDLIKHPPETWDGVYHAKSK